MRAYHLGEGLPLEHLHDDERPVPRVGTDVVDASDVLALQACRGASLSAESLDHGRVARPGGKDLDRDTLIQLDVRRLDDHTHSSSADDALDAKLTDRVAGDDGQ